MYGYPDYQTGMYGAVPQMQARLNQLEGYQAQQLQAAQFNVGQCAQTAMIVNQLRPFPQPAYTVANPYATPTATA